MTRWSPVFGTASLALWGEGEGGVRLQSRRHKHRPFLPTPIPPPPPPPTPTPLSKKDKMESSVGNCLSGAVERLPPPQQETQTSLPPSPLLHHLPPSHSGVPPSSPTRLSSVRSYQCRTGRPGVYKLWVSEKGVLICDLYFSVTARATC